MGQPFPVRIRSPAGVSHAEICETGDRAGSERIKNNPFDVDESSFASHHSQSRLFFSSSRLHSEHSRLSGIRISYSRSRRSYKVCRGRLHREQDRRLPMRRDTSRRNYLETSMFRLAGGSAWPL